VAGVWFWGCGLDYAAVKVWSLWLENYELPTYAMTAPAEEPVVTDDLAVLVEI